MSDQIKNLKAEIYDHMTAATFHNRMAQQKEQELVKLLQEQQQQMKPQPECGEDGCRADPLGESFCSKASCPKKKGDE